jgi:DNA-binding NtrC family response regulator
LPAEVGAAPPAVVQTIDDVRTLADIERDYITAALRASGGNRAKAAERLGIGTATLYRKLKEQRE